MRPKWWVLVNDPDSHDFVAEGMEAQVDHHRRQLDRSREYLSEAQSDVAHFTAQIRESELAIAQIEHALAERLA